MKKIIDSYFMRLKKQIEGTDQIKLDTKGYIDVSPTDQVKISKMQEDGEYILDLKPEINREWILRKNPNYKSQKWMVRATVASSIAALVSSAFIVKESFNKKEVELMKQSIQLQSESIKSLETSLTEMTKTIASLKDTVYIKQVK